MTEIVLSPIDITAPAIVAAARAAEAAGFRAIWTYDHISGVSFGGRPVLDSWTVLAAVAASTTGVTIGPLVVNVVARHPAHIAVATATLQQLSGGRVQLGLGAGAGPESLYSRELAMVGLPLLPAHERRQRVADTVTFLRELWAGEPGYEGIAVPEPVPPIIVAANGPKLAAVAGQVADAVNFHDWQPDLPRAIDAALGAARAAGNDRFEVTLEVPFEDQWLQADSAPRRDAAALGVSRVMVRWHAALGIGAIQRAAAWTETA
ncbi:MAG TPA: LLM class flavin-dependent oxidoreductase [Acidimicrobiales bacterium]|nr:LLM class flavin-dependent oxidoreductase [Acidimicrobiales bacterium]